MIEVYLYENVMQYKVKEVIKEFVFPKNAMYYGKIRNIPIFEETLYKLVKKEKWNQFLKPKNITVILPSHYQEIDKEMLTVLFQNVGIKSIKFKKEINLLPLKNNQVYLNVNQNYILGIIRKKNRVDKRFFPVNIFNSVENTIKHILKVYGDSVRYYLYGTYSSIEKLPIKYNKKDIFYFRNSNHFLLRIEK